MKRVMTILAILLLPLSVWAMTPVADSDLSNVTGQAGVSINADLGMNISIGTMAWGDADGIGSYWAVTTTTGYVGVTGFNITNLRIKARETDSYGTGYPTLFYHGTSTVAGTGAYSTYFLKPITIDVATGNKPVASGGQGAATTFVRFGLGALQVTMDALSFNVALGTAGTALTQQMGSINLGAIGIYFNPNSYVDIYSHGGQGVTFEMYVIIDQFNLAYVSWGDSDGLPGGNLGSGGVTWINTGSLASAGYVGLENLRIGGPITMTGVVTIDVTTLAAGSGAYTYDQPGEVSSPVAPAAKTVCHIAFPVGFDVNVTGPIQANVRLGSANTLAGGQVLGDIYISSFHLNILSSSWVDIWAH